MGGTGWTHEAGLRDSYDINTIHLTAKINEKGCGPGKRRLTLWDCPHTRSGRYHYQAILGNTTVTPPKRKSESKGHTPNMQTNPVNTPHANVHLMFSLRLPAADRGPESPCDGQRRLGIT